MQTRATRMTRKGQVTIPIDIRESLGIHEGDSLIVEQVDGRVVFERVADIVKRTAGVFQAYRKPTPVDPAEERAWVERAVAEEVIASMRDEE